MTLTFTLPLPPRELSPNARVHWAKKARMTRGYRSWAYLHACLQTPSSQRQAWTDAEAYVVFFLPDRRRRDRDNLAASLKAAWDGLVDAGIIADDAGLVHMPLGITVDRERPRVEITLVPLTPREAA